METPQQGLLSARRVRLWPGSRLVQGMVRTGLGRPPTAFLSNVGFAILISAFYLGYNIGAMAGTAMFLQESMDLTDVRTEILVGSLNFVAIGGAHLGCLIADRYGRARSLLLSSILYLIGAVVSAAAPSYAIVFLGRTFSGLGLGAGLAVNPLYLSEMAPSDVRGKVVSISELGLNMGILGGYVCSYAFSSVERSVAWRYVFAVGGAVALLLVCLMSWLPESPRWLATKGRHDEARRVLMLCGHGEETESTIEAVSAQMDRALGVMGRPRLCIPREHCHAVFVAVSLAVFQQLSGVEVSTYYVPFILHRAGMESDRHVLAATIAIGLIKILVVVGAMYAVDGSLGRRTLILMSIAGVILSHASLAAGLHMDNMVLDFVGLVGFVVSYAIGLGPVVWLVINEALPLPVRASGLSLAIMLNRLTSALSSSTYLSLADAVGPPMSFVVLCGVNMAAFVCVAMAVPETSGRSLEGIQHAAKTASEEPLNQKAAATE